MRNHFRSAQELAEANLWLTEYIQGRRYQKKKNVLDLSKLSQLVYQSLAEDYPQSLEWSPTFPDLRVLEQDLFAALYSPAICKRDAAKISFMEQCFNMPILDLVMQDDRFLQLKQLCENKELPAFEAAVKFCESLRGPMEERLRRAPEFRYCSIVALLDKQIEQLILEMTERRHGASKDTEKHFLQLYNKLIRKVAQIKNLHQKLKACAIQSVDFFSPAIGQAINAALEQALQVNVILSAWGSDHGTNSKLESDRKLLEHTKNSKVLQDIAKSLGKYREIIADKRKNGFSYGLGEKYDVTLGNDITQCISSELATLGTEETEWLFLRKYEQKRLMQYRKRAAVVKGKGEMIVLIDESSSTRSVASWAKAFALALLDIAAKDKRKFAMIHFSSADRVKTDLFEPGHYHAEDVMNAAEQFFGGGTNFEAPLQEALRLMEQGYEDADITIITDGECRLKDSFAEEFRNKILQYHAEVTGILLDKENPCGKSLEPFCTKIYHSRDLVEDEIARQILSQKVS